MVARLAIHVLDDNHARRAQIARCAYALGHHAEVYSDPNELAAHAPEGGVVVALESALNEGISGLRGLLNREGRWLAIIATSPDPSIAKAVRAIKDGALDYLPLPLEQHHSRAFSIRSRWSRPSCVRSTSVSSTPGLGLSACPRANAMSWDGWPLG